eukprot:TRINITY_DN19439_c0_g1_i1.p1 TRINITY_DN19439_c0_g1~~TRINITY_DN19439_c0_g1_i1.p1  ORF type:complete len:363 (-),score=51.34 TRINITY_DN19439_c0_g1_i1:146-1234(-)
MGKCGSMSQMACTVLFALTWALFFIVVIVVHGAVGSLVPAVRDFPDNLSRGFREGFGFQDLEQGADDVRAQATEALAKCGISKPSFSCPAVYKYDSCQCDTTAEKNQIQSIFDSTLTTIQKVVNDKYLGVSEFQSSANSLNQITSELENAPSGSSPCDANNAVYCQIFTDTTALKDSVTEVNKEIDNLSGSDGVKAFQDNASALNVLHALPSMMFISMLFLTCFWFAEKPACCCCGGRFLSGCAWFMHLSFCSSLWFVCVLFVAIRNAMLQQMETTTIKDVSGNPTVKQLVDHLQKAWPQFWDIGLKKFVDELDGFVNSMAATMALVMIIFVYSCLLCVMCGKPYAASKDARSVDIAVVPMS